MNAIDKGERHVGLGCVDDIVEDHDKSLLPMPSQNTKRNRDRSKGLEQGLKVVSSDMRNSNGVITVSTTENTNAPLSHVDLSNGTRSTSSSCSLKQAQVSLLAAGSRVS